MAARLPAREENPANEVFASLPPDARARRPLSLSQTGTQKSGRTADLQFAFAVKPPRPRLCEGGGEDARGDMVSMALRQGWAARRQSQSSEPSHKQTGSVRLLFCYAFTLIIQQWLADKVSVPLSPNNRPISSPSE